MKQATILLIAIFLFACKKQELKTSDARPAKQEQYWINNVITHGRFMGVGSGMDTKNLGGGPQKSSWTSCSFDNDVWMQFGYVQWGSPGLVTMIFYTKQPYTTEVINPYPVLKTNMKHFYAIRIEDGDVITSIDGMDLTRFKGLGVSYMRTITVSTENGRTSTPSFPKLNYYPALQHFENGEWKDVSSAYFHGSGGWGAEGRLQNPKLRFNEVNMGGNLKPLFETLF